MCVCVHPFFIIILCLRKGFELSVCIVCSTRIGTLRHSARPTRYGGGYTLLCTEELQRNYAPAAAVSRQSVAFDGVLAAAAASWPKVLSVLFKTSSLEGPLLRVYVTRQCVLVLFSD